MKKVFIVILFIKVIVNVELCAQILPEAGKEKKIQYSNYRASFNVERVYLDYFKQGYIILEGVFTYLDKAGAKKVPINSKVQVIFHNYWFNDTIPVGDTMQLVVCNYNSVHYIKTPSGGMISNLSHYGDSERCYLAVTDFDRERNLVEICPNSELPLFLCADYLQAGQGSSLQREQ